MYLVAIGWIYVVLMMSITEETIVAGVMTILFYGLLPVGIILYLGDSPRRRLKRKMEEEARLKLRPSVEQPASDAQEHHKSDFPPS
jgi:hypothetical protein